MREALGKAVDIHKNHLANDSLLGNMEKGRLLSLTRYVSWERARGSRRVGGSDRKRVTRFHTCRTHCRRHAFLYDAHIPHPIAEPVLALLFVLPSSPSCPRRAFVRLHIPRLCHLS